ncbi:MAG: polysaccharide deacetylase [Lachnospiraceae bacterium]|nr:polysaccharide deacetylase [Ruminococcus sp.]MCM1274907.1 polysaccharide deacetylase [Lachnospiraceae bacterium]
MEDKLKAAEEENRRMSLVADVLVRDNAGTLEGFDEIFARSGIAYTDLIAFVNERNDVSVEEIYGILSGSGLTDKEIIAIAAAKNTVNGESLYEIMSKNGVSDKELIGIIANKSGGTIDDYYEILKQCGLSDGDIVAYINKKNQGSSGSSSSSSGNSSSSSSSSSTESTSSAPEETSEPQSQYELLYEDMYVSEPVEYVREDKTVYLTFDDGPSESTYSILSYLRASNVKATFFVVPNRSEECAATLRAIAADGHAIGVHSASHEYEKIYASVEAFLDDFYEAWDIIRDATGISTEIFRFPGGSNNDYNVDTREAIIAEMSRRGFRFYDWNVDSYDVAGATWTQMYNSIPLDVRNNSRSIVLMHDAKYRQNTVLVLEDIIKVLLDEGYKFDKINSDTKPVQFVGPFA